MTFPGDEKPGQGAPEWWTPSKRNPLWFSVAVLAIVIGVAIPTAAMNLVKGSAGMALAASTLFAVSSYVAFNFRPAAARLYVLSLWIGLGVGLIAGGRSHIGTAWLIFGFVSIAGAELLSRGTTALRDAAVTDPLTGLQNRIGLWEECERAITICRRLDQPLTLVHIDLDDFKEVNDRDGHAEGDRILKLCGERWREVIRAGDTLARIGGDEFLMVLPGSTRDDARKLMGHLREVSPIEWCFGTAELDPDEDIQSCVDRADVELYAAKAARQDGQASPEPPAGRLSPR